MQISKRYKRYALGVFTATYTLSFMDRTMLGILMESMKQDLQLSDAQLGFLTGLAFAVFYAGLGIPIARWADRGNRITIASMAIGIWSVMLFTTGFVVNFLQLALVRIGAAVGEAGVFPPAYSLIGDYFPVKERTRALSIYMAGISVAIIVGYLLAGWINQYYGWRVAFIAISVPGVLATILIRFTLPEPRQGAGNTQSQQSEQAPLIATVKTLWRQSSYRYMVLALSLTNIAGLGLSQWYPSFFIRQHGIETGELGLWLGLGAGISGAVATWLGGHLADRFFANNARGQLRVCIVSSILVFFCVGLLLLSPSQYLALSMLIPIYALNLFYYGPLLALVQRLVDERMRAVSLAFLLLVLNLIGMGLGPQMIGILSDVLNPHLGNPALATSMIIVSSTVFFAAYFFWKASNHIDEELVLAEGGDDHHPKENINDISTPLDTV